MNYLSLDQEVKDKFKLNLHYVRDSWVIKWIKYIDVSNTKQLRCLMTILYSTRVITLDSRPDFKSITTPSTNRVYSVDKSLVEKFWKSLGISKYDEVPQSVRWKRGKYSTANGPNGPAMPTLFTDLSLLTDDYIGLIRTVGGEKLESEIRYLIEEGMGPMSNQGSLVEKESRSQEKDTPCLRRLADFSDKEGKTRIIGIVDYFTQNSLDELHSGLNDRLKQINQDCTFDQGSFKQKSASWLKAGSFDLSNATDRFPIDVIRDLLAYPFGEEYANAGASLMVDSPFYHNEIPYRYAVGNPMGAKSSGPSFTLAHHFILFCSSQNAGIAGHEAKYCMLGDDIIIGDSVLAALYKVSIHELDVEISYPKSFENSRLIEFAKRLILDGEEISPAPVRGLISCGTSYTRIASFWKVAKSREHVVSDGQLADCTEMGIRSGLGDYQNNLGRAHYRELRAKVQISALFTRFFGKEIGPATFLNEVMRACGYTGVAFSKATGSWLISRFLFHHFRRAASQVIRDSGEYSLDKWTAAAFRCKAEVDPTYLRLPGSSVMIDMSIAWMRVIQVAMHAEDKNQGPDGALLIRDMVEAEPRIGRSVALPSLDSIFRLDSDNDYLKANGRLTSVIYRLAVSTINPNSTYLTPEESEVVHLWRENLTQTLPGGQSLQSLMESLLSEPSSDPGPPLKKLNQKALEYGASQSVLMNLRLRNVLFSMQSPDWFIKATPEGLKNFGSLLTSVKTKLGTDS